jgi:hypothetical protein
VNDLQEFGSLVTKLSGISNEDIENYMRCWGIENKFESIDELNCDLQKEDKIFIEKINKQA